MELKDIKQSELIFTDVIVERKYCEIFLVSLRGLTCAMKVHHGREPWRLPLETEDREYNIFKCESRAYKRLSEAGICARGITHLYGILENINPKLCLPHLRHFLQDEFPPTAIFLEYTPNMKELNWTNYCAERMQNFINGMHAIHKAFILHSDVYPRNMMIVEGDPERNIWIDFDRAQTYNGELSEQQKEWMEWEQEVVADIGEKMRRDAEAGRYDKTLMFY